MPCLKSHMYAEFHHDYILHLCKTLHSTFLYINEVYVNQSWTCVTYFHRYQAECTLFFIKEIEIKRIHSNSITPPFFMQSSSKEKHEAIIVKLLRKLHFHKKSSITVMNGTPNFCLNSSGSTRRHL